MIEYDGPSRSLQTQWAACGIAAAAARFVPVPLADDVIRERALRIAISRTLRAHGQPYSTALIEPLWGDGESVGEGMVRRYTKHLATRLATYPVRKYRALFGAVHGVPNDVMRVLLIARTVDRRLARGELADADPAVLADQARRIRAAYDAANRHMDLQLLRSALADVLSQGKGLTVAAVRYARRGFGRKGAEPTLEPDGEVGAGAQQVSQVLHRPEIVRLMERFDEKVDAALAGSRPSQSA
jgi:hypothetical protein